MKDIKLPIIKGIKNEKRVLSMDEYLQFVQFNLKHTFDRKSYEEQKKQLGVNVPFSLR